MSGFRFAEPQWAYAFYALAVFVGLLFWFERRGGGALDRFVSSALRERLVQAPSAWRRRLRIVLLSLSAVFLILALMRPQWGMHFVTAKSFGAEIMICIDVSKSMLAEDVAPNRLERAKAEVADLLTYMDGNQVGIIAFAGRASVLSPLTPDFGFLRLVLDGMGAHSVTRGGTRLEEPIRKALAGFGPPGAAARVVLLITDGEDHDSFPLDAARSAAEAGVRILTIGFGDEKGSQVYVTDRRSGARELLRDANGEPVVSRLDGDLLREIALTTQGAYVPAGTGVLELESIYQRHIAPLTRAQLAERGRMVRQEAYPWAVLVGLLLLVACVAVAGGGVDVEGSGLGKALWTIAILLPLLAPPLAGRAQPDDGAADGQGAALEQEAAVPEGEAPEEAPAPEDPREVYNGGIAALGGHDLEEAEHRFREARREAGADGVLRFHVAYNLGWTLAGRAEALQESEPEQALRSLYEAADWFREAVRLRPDDTKSRHNLEVVLNRALLLADALAKQGEEDLEASLEALAAGQREAVAGVAGLLERVAGEAGPHVAEPLRPEFRAAATAQRTLLSDADQLSKRADVELEGIAAKSEEERTPQDQMRAAQLENLLHYMHRARERMGQARQQLRRREAERAYRRSAAALDELKRALDQLRDPVAVLDGVIESASEVATYTGVLSASEGQLLPQEGKPRPPAWLTREYLVEAQQGVAERTGELHARLQAGLAQGSPAGAEAARQLEAVEAAEPLVDQGHDALSRAARELETDLRAALQAQIEAIGALREARELFLDLRGLLEAVYADERRIGAVLSGTEEEAREALPEFLPSLRSAQQKNLDRAERLATMLDDEARALENPFASPEAEGEGDAEALEAQRQRLETADTLLDLASGEMEDGLESLGGGKGRAGGADFAAAAEHTERAVSHLEALRRLFFSTVERIREIAARQLELADSTQEIAALPADGAAAEKLGPLLPRQKTLSKRTESIAFELEEQSRQPDAGADPKVAGETTERLRSAAEHLLFAQGSMDGAATSLEAEPPNFDEARADQEAALAELAKALEQLVPPEQRQQGQGESGEGQEQQAEQERQGGQQGRDPAQLLQGVRDREAQRREERERKGQVGYETVEKDW